MKSNLLIKLGGRAFENAQGYTELANGLKKLEKHQTIVVHGGGADISQALRRAEREPRFVDGFRVTSKEDMAIVEQVLSGEVNARIIDHLTRNGIACRSLSGRSQGLFIVRPFFRNGQSLGYVGEIERVNPEAVFAVLAENLTPVVSPVSADISGDSYNVNADSAAAALAVATACSDLIFFTDVPGVQVGDRVQPTLSVAQTQKLIAAGQIRDGMVAKMESIYRALDGGVSRVHITRWQGEHTLEAALDNKLKQETIICKE